MKAWQASLLTLYPEMFPGFLANAVTGRGLRAGIWSYNTLNIRDFAKDKHRSVDSSPAGGGPGMVMKPEVVDAALKVAVKNDQPLIYLSPHGRIFDQALAIELANGPGVTMLCGRFEGVDQRVIDKWHPIEVSLGDFVLSGGEPAALVMLDSIIRLLPGVLGDQNSLDQESFVDGLLEYPHYTRPAKWDNRAVPEILLSGHHGKIAAWRKAQSESRTRNSRPDLWTDYMVKNKKNSA